MSESATSDADAVAADQPVHVAMAQERPEKAVMRQLWLETAEAAAGDQRGKAPLYLTLPGALGLDIQLLIDAGLVRRTENGNIEPKDAGVVVAVESNPKAALEVKRQFPGLRVIAGKFENVLAGQSSVRYPSGDNETAAKAKIVNLDLNQPLKVTVKPDGTLSLTLIRLLAKLAQLHTEPEPSRWWLCLTLHGEITWDNAAGLAIWTYLRQNIEVSVKYGLRLKSLLGTELVEDIKNLNVRELSSELQQKVLLALVPKRIAFETHHQGWRIATRENVRYGGVESRAPMTSWILEFVPEPSASTNAHAVYVDCVEQSLNRTRHILSNGESVTEEHAPADE